MGRPAGSVNKDKPFRDAIRIEMALAAEGKACEAPAGSIRYIARQTLIRAGTETAAAKEIGDRLDGKAAQALEMSGGLTVSHEDALAELDK